MICSTTPRVVSCVNTCCGHECFLLVMVPQHKSSPHTNNIVGCQLRENIHKGVFVDGLVEKAVTSAVEAYEVRNNLSRIVSHNCSDSI